LTALQQGLEPHLACVTSLQAGLGKGPREEAGNGDQQHLARGHRRRQGQADGDDLWPLPAAHRLVILPMRQLPGVVTIPAEAGCDGARLERRKGTQRADTHALQAAQLAGGERQQGDRRLGEDLGLPGRIHHFHAARTRVIRRHDGGEASFRHSRTRAQDGGHGAQELFRRLRWRAQSPLHACEIDQVAPWLWRNPDCRHELFQPGDDALRGRLLADRVRRDDAGLRAESQRFPQALAGPDTAAPRLWRGVLHYGTLAWRWPQDERLPIEVRLLQQRDPQRKVRNDNGGYGHDVPRFPSGAGGSTPAPLPRVLEHMI
jgi:hypothetical protein